jgi:hypothetical protein
LGQKQTFAVQERMSALPPKATLQASAMERRIAVRQRSLTTCALQFWPFRFRKG